jgi:hypothetical protein
VLKALQGATLALGNHLQRRRGGERAEKGISGAEGWTECHDLTALGWVGLKGRNQIGDREHELEQSSWSTDWMERGRRSRTGAGRNGAKAERQSGRTTMGRVVLLDSLSSEIFAIMKRDKLGFDETEA